MPDIIQLLPESLANQIAAGEVVQRPASVVKELLENSIDARATEVSLILKDAGKTMIQVVDNGNGMSETDARMSFERHATSKIKQSADLFNIRTFGFRGEALASIAAVAQVELKTRQPNQDTGIFLEMEGSVLKQQESIAHPLGTSIAVKNLFFNVPARRKFLKSNAVEFRHILDEYTRVALANPSVSFQLFHNGQEHNTLSPGKLARRIVGLLGKNYQQQLIPCQEEVQDYRMEGYIGKPEAAKKTRGDQFFFVNDRFIKHPYLHHAIMNAFEGLLPDDHYPFYLLKIYLDPQEVDVNVHPTKTEVKFEDEHALYAIVRAAVKQALGSHGITPSLDFGFNVNFSEQTEWKADVENQTASPSGNTDWESKIHPSKLNQASAPSFSSTNGGSFAPAKPSTNNWESLYEIAKNDFSGSAPTLQLDSSLNQGPATPESSHSVPNALQLYDQFLLCQVKSGWMLIDQQAAHERILYEKYLNQMKSGEGISQQLLFPKRMNMTLPEIAILEEYRTEVEKLGFTFQILGQEVTITGAPSGLKRDGEEEVFSELIAQAQTGEQSLALQSTESMASLLAKRTCIKSGYRFSPEEIQTFIGQLFTTSNPNYTPDGQKVMKLIDPEGLKEWLL